MTKLTPTKEIGGEDQHQSLCVVRRHDFDQCHKISILDVGVTMVETLMCYCQNNLRKPFRTCKSKNQTREMVI